MEILAGVRSESTATDGNFVYCFDYATAVEEWRSPDLGIRWDEVSQVLSVDLEGDGAPEVAAWIRSGEFFLFDGKDGAQLANLQGAWSSMTMLKESKNGRGLLLLGDQFGIVRGYRWVDGVLHEVMTHSFGTKPIDGLNATRAGQLAVGTEGRIDLYRIPDLTKIGQTANYGPRFGERIRWRPGRPGLFSIGVGAVLAFLE